MKRRKVMEDLKNKKGFFKTKNKINKESGITLIG